MRSIFDKIYSYRESETKNARENFLSEIFSFCLSTDNFFLYDFLALLEISEMENFNITTQKVYEFGRPDVEIQSLTTSILIECKVDSSERFDQLNDYKKILDGFITGKKNLVYLTKYHEAKNLKFDCVKFHEIKWSQIFKIINENNLQITQQLKLYLKDQNMADTNNFNYYDLSALKSIAGTIEKMDEILNGIKPMFYSYIGNFSKDSSRSTRLKESRYVNYYDLNYKGEYIYSIEAGFYWWNHDVTVGLRIYIPNKTKDKFSKQIIEFVNENLVNWNEEVWDGAHNYWYEKSLAEFIPDNKDQIPEIISYLHNGIEELAIFKNLKL